MVSLLLGVTCAAAGTAFLYWLPRSERWLVFREQRRMMVPYRISPERFGKLERISAIVGPLLGLLVTIALFVKLVAEAT